VQNTPATPPAAPKAKPAAPKPVPPAEFQAGKISSASEQEAIAQLQGNATTFQKAKACQRLATVGTKAAVPALASLLTDERLSTYARYGLEPIPDPAVDETLREALSKTKGALLAGIINSISVRKDAKAIPALSKLVNEAQPPEIARAAASAIGHISGPEATRFLQSALQKTKGPLRTAVADAALICAEQLLQRGDRAAAMSLYETLTGKDIPKQARLAAMHGIINSETALGRPRP
jgi:hypothetical protein